VIGYIHDIRGSALSLISIADAKGSRQGGSVKGTIKGTMAFNREDHGMTNGIPFAKIADTVEVTVDLTGTRVCGLRWSLNNRQPATLLAAALRARIMEYGGRGICERGSRNQKPSLISSKPPADPSKMEIH
jgi:hypothetical protein